MTQQLTYKGVLKLGWKDRSPKNSKRGKGTGSNSFKFGEYIMVVLWKWDEDFHDVFINDAEGVLKNVWENSEPLFRGMIKTVDDLYRVMQFVGIIEYKLYE